MKTLNFQIDFKITFDERYKKQANVMKVLVQRKLQEKYTKELQKIVDKATKEVMEGYF